MKKINLLCIGKLNNKEIFQLERNYIKRFKQIKFTIYELKAHQEDVVAEGQEIRQKLKSLSPTFPIFMTERGRQFDSVNFAQWLQKQIETHDSISFVIGGAAGFDPLLIKSKQQLSLSPLTFPHKLARLLLIEQIYRAETINLGHPYNK
jgi:23S rRNA (pseudouridine1915-N3)-methyltransferase